MFKTQVKPDVKAVVEYAQEVIDLRGGSDMSEIVLDVEFEEMGG